jgi:hypothetical protein
MWAAGAESTRARLRPSCPQPRQRARWTVERGEEAEGAGAAQLPWGRSEVRPSEMPEVSEVLAVTEAEEAGAKSRPRAPPGTEEPLPLPVLGMAEEGVARRRWGRTGVRRRAVPRALGPGAPREGGDSSLRSGWRGPSPVPPAMKPGRRRRSASGPEIPGDGLRRGPPARWPGCRQAARPRSGTGEWRRSSTGRYAVVHLRGRSPSCPGRPSPGTGPRRRPALRAWIRTPRHHRVEGPRRRLLASSSHLRSCAGPTDRRRERVT